MELFKWDESFSVGVEKLDSQHKQLIDMINKLYYNMKLGKSTDILVPLFFDLFEYTQVHFRFEEKLMLDKKFPLFQLHKKEHDNFINELDDIYNKFNHKSISAGFDVMELLKNWLINHICLSDKKYKPYMKEGLSSQNTEKISSKTQDTEPGPVNKYISDAKAKTPEQFTNIYRHPFLVEYKDTSASGKENKITFLTVAETSLEKLIKEQSYNMFQNEIKNIFSLKKTEKNSFASKIIVGRTTSQDISIDNLSISKFHAYFESKDGISFSLTDKGSTNGTKVNGAKLVPGQPVLIKDKDFISFAAVSVVFFTSETAYKIFKGI